MKKKATADDPVVFKDEPQSLMDHLEELRNRILFSVLLVVVCTVLSYSFIPRIMEIITQPVGKLYFLSPAEGFWVQLKLAMYIGLYFSLPLIFYQIWRFVEIGLKQRERTFLGPLALCSFILFTIGGAFCYYLVIPVAVKFLLSYASDTLVPLISVSRYLSFIGALIFAFGITFQLPLVMIFLGRLGIVNSLGLRKFRRAAVLASFVIGAALTPTPDMVNQTMLALPIIVLYEISIWLVMIFEKKEGKRG